MTRYDNGLDDQFGLVHINGGNNSVMPNHISEAISPEFLKPPGERPVVIRLVSGRGNYVASNHIVATTESSQANDDPNSACFSTQVEALLSTRNLTAALDVVAIKVEPGSVQNTILDSGGESQVVIDRAVNAFRATPVPGRSPPALRPSRRPRSVLRRCIAAPQEKPRSPG